MTNRNENQKDNIDHDGAFKELLHQLFEQFLRLFFPAQAEQLDFSDFTFLEQERLTDFPSGRHRFIDTLAEMKKVDGENILVHVGFQSERERDFPLQMFLYFSQLRLRHDTPIWPIVLYMPKGCGGVGFFAKNKISHSLGLD